MKAKGFGLIGYLLAGALGLGALFALWWAVERHGYQRGQIEERELWQAREATELASANALIEKLQREAREAEHRAAEDLARLSMRYQQEQSDANRKNAAVIADLRTGVIRLRDHEATAGQGACPGPAGEAAAAASGGHAPEGTNIHATTAGALGELMAEADDVVRQLAAAQDVIRRYYEMCGEGSHGD